MYLGEKLGLLRSLGNVEELGGGGGTGGGKGKGKEEEKGREGVKTLASLVGDEGMARIAEKVGPELEAVAQLQVLRECVLHFPSFPFPPLVLTSSPPENADKKRSSSPTSTTPTLDGSLRTPSRFRRVSTSSELRSHILALLYLDHRSSLSQ